MMDLLSWPLDTAGFVPRWFCGNWSSGLGWVHIASDALIWLAYLAIPLVLVHFIRRRRDVPFPRIFWLFGAFILTCGTTHLLEVVIFYDPVYRLAAAVKVLTAIASWATVFALLAIVPQALALKSPRQLEEEVTARTAELAAANAELRLQIEERKKAEEELRVQQEWFRVVLASIGDAIVATDSQGRVAFLNPVAEQITGWDREAAVGRPVEEIVRTIDEDTRQWVESPVARVLNDARAVGLANHTLLASRTGIERIVDRSASPIRDGKGQVLGVVMAIRDATERRTAEETRARLAAIVEGTADAVVGRSVDGTILSWNAGAEQLYGYTAAEAIGKSVDFLTPPDKREELHRVFERLERGERVPPFESVRIRKGGRRVEISLTASLIRGENGSVIGKSVIARDISELKAAEEALKAARSEAERGLAQLKAVLSTMEDGLVLSDAEGNLVDWNRAALRLHGFASVEEVRHHLSEFATDFAFRHPDGSDLPFEEWPLRRVLRGEELHDVEMHLYRLDTKQDWFVIYSGSLLLDSDGRIELAVLTMHDVTQRRRAEEASRHSAELLRGIADNTPDAVFVKDRDGRYLLFNNAASRYVGLPVEEVIGRDDLELFDPAEAEKIMKRDRLVMEEERPAVEEERLTAAGITRTYSVTKAPYRDARGTVIGLVGIGRDISDRKIAEETLRRSETRYRSLVSALSHRVWTAAPNGELLTMAGGEEFVPRPERRLLSAAWQEIIHPDDVAGMQAGWMSALAEGRAFEQGYRIRRTDGQWRRVTARGVPIRDEEGKVREWVGLTVDHTEQWNLEEQFRQAQKMEAFGQLAGGVAHDFNNLLTVINGYGTLLLDSLPPADSNRELVREMTTAGTRAAALTHQLLAFSRKTVLAPRVLDLNAIVSDVEKMLRRVIGEDIRLATRLQPGLGQIKADAGLLEQAILNLAVNSRDAMPQGGTLTIETGDFGSAGSQPEVMLVVSDTGHGMTPEVRARIFEPFFTTKEPDRGTGLGLAMVFGTVRQSNGRIAVESEPGSGTTFRIYLPRVDAPAPKDSRIQAAPTPPNGWETVLIVEDEEAILALTRLVLARCGYRVLTASDMKGALEVAQAHADPIHLILTDVIMPGGGGPEVAARVTRIHTEAKVLYLSGYTDDSIVRHGVMENSVNFLAKPFTPMILARKVRAVLDAAPVEKADGDFSI